MRKDVFNINIPDRIRAKFEAIWRRAMDAEGNPNDLMWLLGELLRSCEGQENSDQDVEYKRELNGKNA